MPKILLTGIVASEFSRAQPNKLYHALHIQKLHEIGQITASAIGPVAGFLRRQVKPVHPKCRKAERLGPGGVPSSEGHEQNIFARRAERIDTKLIGTRIGIVSGNSILAENEA